MAEVNLDITSLFERAFGLGRGKPFDPSQAYTDKNRVEAAFEDLPVSDEEEGTEFVSVRNTVGAGSFNGQVLFMPVQIGGITLPNEPTISISGSKIITETSLVGSKRKGTVKELISISDYLITIRGVALNYNSKLVYPEDQVKELHDLFLRDESLDIKCALTSLLGIYKLVIKDFALPEMIGVQHAQAYQFTCVSDEDFILELD